MTQAEQDAFDSVWRLLRHEWDPSDTDMVPDDDYESHALALFGLLREGGTVEEATVHLGRVETLELGLPERRTRNRSIAEKAHALVEAIRGRNGSEADHGAAKPKSRMTPAERKAYGVVRRLLRYEWDPIGVDRLPDDEYDSYALILFGRLLRGASVEEAASYLATVETQWMSLGERPERNAIVAAKAHDAVATLRRGIGFSGAARESRRPGSAGGRGRTRR